MQVSSDLRWIADNVMNDENSYTKRRGSNLNAAAIKAMRGVFKDLRIWKKGDALPMKPLTAHHDAHLDPADVAQMPANWALKRGDPFTAARTPGRQWLKDPNKPPRGKPRLPSHQMIFTVWREVMAEMKAGRYKSTKM